MSHRISKRRGGPYGSRRLNRQGPTRQPRTRLNAAERRAYARRVALRSDLDNGAGGILRAKANPDLWPRTSGFGSRARYSQLRLPQPFVAMPGSLVIPVRRSRSCIQGTTTMCASARAACENFLHAGAALPSAGPYIASQVSRLLIALSMNASQLCASAKRR